MFFVISPTNCQKLHAFSVWKEKKDFIFVEKDTPNNFKCGVWNKGNVFLARDCKKIYADALQLFSSVRATICHKLMIHFTENKVNIPSTLKYTCSRHSS